MGSRLDISRVSIPLALGLLLVLATCGEGVGSGGGGPTEPPAGAEPANIVANGGVEVGLCSGLGLECSYSQEYRNLGPGCANNVRGKVRAFQGDSVLETVEWWLATSTVVRPGETFSVEGCCLTSETVKAATRYAGEAFWNSIPCS